jgi:hypothetical protein
VPLRIEEAFQASKGLCGLDQHQVRRWRSWYRWATLAMLASVFLVVTAVTERRWHPARLGVVELSCNEVQRLFAPWSGWLPAGWSTGRAVVVVATPTSGSCAGQPPGFRSS